MENSEAIGFRRRRAPPPTEAAACLKNYQNPKEIVEPERGQEKGQINREEQRKLRGELVRFLDEHCVRALYVKWRGE